MNIHINKEKFDYIINNTKIFGKFIIGSRLYGLSDENSDYDYLIIYNPFKNELISPFTTHHQYQYKDVENNIDYNLVNIIDFVRNLVSGDSTINYELLYSTEFAENEYLGWLSEIKTNFNTYNICRAYLGMAKRDLTQLHKRKTEQDKKRGILHSIRGLVFPYMIRENIVSFEKLRELIEFEYAIINKFNLSVSTQKTHLLGLIEERRGGLNHWLNTGRIIRFLDVETQNTITNKLKDIVEISDKWLDIDDQYIINNNVELKY